MSNKAVVYLELHGRVSCLEFAVKGIGVNCLCLKIFIYSLDKLFLVSVDVIIDNQ